ncbi:hypothetical protein HYU15_00215, partial [Candidatus Woesearchaeota archaeon]|nr:hypothetical protein [Candidatus Woesearchaeota archaeon]
KEMFAKFRPPECADAETPRECYGIMKGLYGTPPECEGLSDDECLEEMKKKGPDTGERPEFPEECKEAGATKPFDCAKLMIEKYGEPEWCEGLGIDECVKESMKHGRGEGGMERPEFPEECKKAGATKPRDCFDVMMAKHGKPPYCEGLSDDECFRESMRRGPGEGSEGRSNSRGDMPEECRGIGADECFGKMQEKYGIPDECRELDRKQCEEIMQARGHVGRPGDMPPECEGLGPEECFETMVNEGKLMECQGLGVEECRARMNENAQNVREEHGFEDGSRREGQMPPDCEGLNKEQCLESMISGGRLPDCEGLSADECRERMKVREGHEGGEAGERREGMRGGGGAGMPGTQGEGQAPPECRGVSSEECGEIMKKKAEEMKERAKDFGKEAGKEGGGGDRGRGGFPSEGQQGRDFPTAGFPSGSFPEGGMPGSMPTMPQNIPQDSPRMPDISTDSGQMPSAPSTSDSGGEGSMPPQG